MVNGVATRVTTSFSPTNTSINQFFGFAADDIWASNSSNLLVHFDGAAWSQRESATPPGSSTLWGSSSNDLWAAQCASSSPGCPLFHFNGTSWSESPIPTPPDPGFFAIYALGGRGPDDVWAMTSGDPLHYDGTKWSFTAPFPLNQPPAAIWGDDSGFWGVGIDGLVVYRP